MRINNEPKLNFEDVLLQPKRSTLSSRKDVDMTRNFTFRNSGKQMNFLPIFASNMDGVGTFSMAKVLQDYKMMTVITKTTGIDEWRKAVGNGVRLQSVSVCTGTNVMWDKDATDWKTNNRLKQRGIHSWEEKRQFIFNSNAPSLQFKRNISFA